MEKGAATDPDMDRVTASNARSRVARADRVGAIAAHRRKLKITWTFAAYRGKVEIITHSPPPFRLAAFQCFRHFGLNERGSAGQSFTLQRRVVGGFGVFFMVGSMGPEPYVVKVSVK